MSLQASGSSSDNICRTVLSSVDVQGVEPCRGANLAQRVYKSLLSTETHVVVQTLPHINLHEKENGAPGGNRTRFQDLKRILLAIELPVHVVLPVRFELTLDAV